VVFNQPGVNILAFIGIGLIPLLRKSQCMATFILKAFVSLSVGVLIGDAVLHLIPEAFGAHSHGPEGHGHGHNHHGHGHLLASVLPSYFVSSCGGGHHHHSEEEKMRPLWIALCLAGGIYLFFLLEQILRSFHKRQQRHSKNEKSNVKPVAWLILMGDTMHNVVDGLLIGATFSVNFKTGIATTLAVFLVSASRLLVLRALCNLYEFH
jgi:zinc transporter ZupT